MENSSLTDAVRLNMSRFGSKMSLKSSFSLKSALLIFMLVFGVLRDHGDAQMDREEANKPPDGADGGAFFALRSCHQQLQGDGGEFFSPDYLCSNPPLWCNWTIQVNPGKRINLHLEDLTPGDVCHLKEDQIHVDEPVSHFGVHKVLQKCWQEVKYTSSSNTLYVVLLIGGWPSPPYRGFYGHYQAFGPLVVYNPPGGLLDGHGQSEPSAGLMDLSEVGPDINGEQVESSPDDSNLMYDYFDQPSAQIPELPWEVLDSHTEVGENHRQASESYNHVTDVPVSTSETSQLGRGFNHSPPSRSVPAVYPASQNHELQRTPTAVRRDVKEASVLPEEAAVPEVEMNTQSWGEEETPAGGPEQAAEDEKWTEVSEASDQNPSFSAGLEPEEQIHLRPDMVEPLSDHRGNSNVRNHSAVPHLPGDQLFEVAVEVTFPQDLESWDDQARSLLLSVKTLISKQLEALHSPLSMSSKRIKRLNAGVLYILWLQIKQSPGGLQGHRAVHSALQGLIAMRVSFRESLETAVIISMSTADVNECGTQLVLCDINADCVNHFGSYSCHCRPGFQDESRLGSGGTVCVDLKAAGCSSGLSAETRGVYVLFFLLSTLILMLLVVAGVMYHHHHRGSFLVRCHSSSSSISPPDLNNNDHHHDHDYSCPADSHLPPPPPPTRGPRGSWTHRKEHYPAVDLPLLRFSPLVPPDGYMEPQENERK